MFLSSPYFNLNESQKMENNLTILDPLNQGVALGKYCTKINQILKGLKEFNNKII